MSGEDPHRLLIRLPTDMITKFLAPFHPSYHKTILTFLWDFWLTVGIKKKYPGLGEWLDQLIETRFEGVWEDKNDVFVSALAEAYVSSLFDVEEQRLRYHSVIWNLCQYLTDQTDCIVDDGLCLVDVVAEAPYRFIVEIKEKQDVS